MRTYENLKQRYHEAKSGMSTSENIVKRWKRSSQDSNLSVNSVACMHVV